MTLEVLKSKENLPAKFKVFIGSGLYRLV